ncbi:hypothetical protein T265_04943 [Opisthorchis viverrini]|uniref:Uncharacterized protein n=1 Tax=Opisthorchis viverrini TaxID=6198 RepID=A0A074ZLI2_OPIVI|nr:hypothetical protein T265_04943 [Opisthorchis viverrini]KER28188.1 hypothetical protein T265_04943 [Opisthorchis viverrini]
MDQDGARCNLEAKSIGDIKHLMLSANLRGFDLPYFLRLDDRVGPEKFTPRAQHHESEFETTKANVTPAHVDSAGVGLILWNLQRGLNTFV